MVANGTLHCGAGCTLGDICAEWLVFAFPAIAVAFGWQSIFGERLPSGSSTIYLLTLWHRFQYFTIAPMRGLSLGGIMAA